jgi:hypothetical protein
MHMGDEEVRERERQRESERERQRRKERERELYLHKLIFTQHNNTSIAWSSGSRIYD